MMTWYHLLYTAGLALASGISVFFSFHTLKVFLKKPFSYGSLLQWALLIVVAALFSGGLTYFMPETWQKVIHTVLMHFNCMLAFNLLIFRIQDFVIINSNYVLSNWIIWIAIVFEYLILSFNAVMLITIDIPFIFHLEHAGIEYLARTAVLFSLLFELVARLHHKELIQPPAFNASEDYQNYDNQW